MLVTQGFGQTSLSGVRHGFMPPQLKTKPGEQITYAQHITTGPSDFWTVRCLCLWFGPFYTPRVVFQGTKAPLAQCFELQLRWRFYVHASTSPEIYF